MKIVNLQVENVKRVKAVEISPNGELVVIGGMNAQGKSSILDSIEMALGGKSSIPAEPIRRGEAKGRIVVEIGGNDGYVVERQFTEKGSYLTVKRPNGTKVGAPQAILDSLYSKVSFDPLAFMRSKPMEQAALLRGLVGLDFAKQDRERQKIYDQRTEVNRQEKEASAAAENAPYRPEVPEKEVDLKSLMDEAQKRRDANKANDDARKHLESQHKRLGEIVNDAAKKKAEIERLQAELADLLGRIEKGKAWCQAEGLRIAGIVDADVADVERRIVDIGEVNAAVIANRERARLVREAATLKEKSAELTRQIEAIDAAKAIAMAEAKWPIAGLGFSEDGVTLNGLPLEQGSSAEQLRVSVAIGFALNPGLRVLLIRDGSLLDDNSLAAVAKQAHDADGQVWVERVGHGAECSVIIEDGEIKG